MTAQILTQSTTPPAEQRLLLEGVSWQQYETLLATLGDDFPNLRLSYLEGTLEIMTTSPEHEELKKMISMLLEAYFQETRTRFHAIGSATFRKAMKLRGLEPDECYCLEQKKEFPDLAIEVVLTSGIIDKLDIYRGLGVAEVWQWRDGKFVIYHLRTDGYEQMEQSELLPDLDVQRLANYVNPAEQFDAVMAYRELIRSLG
jgi:Uma2 family endonuclease